MLKKSISVIGLFVCLCLALPIVVAETEHKKHEGHNHHEKANALNEKGHDDENKIELTPEQVKRFEIQTLKLVKGNFQQHVVVPGQVTLNENKVTHVVASIPGVAKEIHKGLGELTKPGDILATLQSREMAEVKSAYISACNEVNLKKDLLEREEKLWRQKIKAETQYIQTKNSYENSKIELEQKKQKLLALGVDENTIQDLPQQKNPLNIYTIEAPTVGKIIERHITTGEVITADKQLFVIANLDTVWISLAVPMEDLPKIKKDQQVILFNHKGEAVPSGTITYVSPVINEDSRSGKAIVELDNKSQIMHPGDFITAQIIVSEESGLLSLPSSALQKVKGVSVVFLMISEGKFELRPIQTKGSEIGEFIEVLSGLQAGDEIAVKNTFLLKAELGKSEAEHSH